MYNIRPYFTAAKTLEDLTALIKAEVQHFNHPSFKAVVENIVEEKWFLDTPDSLTSLFVSLFDISKENLYNNTLHNPIDFIEKLKGKDLGFLKYEFLSDLIILGKLFSLPRTEAVKFANFLRKDSGLTLNNFGITGQHIYASLFFADFLQGAVGDRLGQDVNYFTFDFISSVQRYQYLEEFTNLLATTQDALLKQADCYDFKLTQEQQADFSLYRNALLNSSLRRKIFGEFISKTASNYLPMLLSKLELMGSIFEENNTPKPTQALYKKENGIECFVSTNRSNFEFNESDFKQLDLVYSSEKLQLAVQDCVILVDLLVEANKKVLEVLTKVSNNLYPNIESYLTTQWDKTNYLVYLFPYASFEQDLDSAEFLKMLDDHSLIPSIKAMSSEAYNAMRKNIFVDTGVLTEQDLYFIDSLYFKNNNHL